MPRQKATIYLDPEIRVATKLAAVSGQKSESAALRTRIDGARHAAGIRDAPR